MGFIGFWALGATANFLAVTENSSSIPTTPDAAPTFRVYGSGETPVSTGTMVAFDTDDLDNVYQGQFSVDGGFARGGNYNIVASYHIGGQLRELVYTMSVY